MGNKKSKHSRPNKSNNIQKVQSNNNKLEADNNKDLIFKKIFFLQNLI